MLSQIIPSRPTGKQQVRARVPRGFWLTAVPCRDRREYRSPAPAGAPRAVGVRLEVRPGGGVDGPLRLPFHQQAGRQGARLDPGSVPGRAGEGRLRGALRLSGARPGQSRLRWPCTASDDRRDPVALLAFLGRMGVALDGAQRHFGSVEGRPGRADHAERGAEGACRHRRYRHLRRAGAQVPDLGAGALQGASRGCRGKLRDVRRMLGARTVP